MSVGLLHVEIKAQFVGDAMVWLSISKDVSYSSKCGPVVRKELLSLPYSLTEDLIPSLPCKS